MENSSDAQALRDFWAVYSVHYDEIGRGMAELALRQPRIQELLGSVPPAALRDQQIRGRLHLGWAIVDGEWASYFQGLRAQGAIYAQAGLGFDAWFPLFGAFQTLTIPHLIRDCAGDSAKLASALTGMTRLVEITLPVISQAYFEQTEQLRRKARDLERSNVELERFAYVASHDLQEPLRTATAFAGLLAERYARKLDEQADDYFRHVTGSLEKMQRMIRDLLDYSRIGTDARPPEPVDLSAAVREALQNLSTAVAESGASVQVDPLPTLPADRFQMVQLFQNLIGNAVKFRGDRQPRIRVAAAQANGEWTFSVRDNGVGIAPEDLERIFGVFERGRNRKRYPGSGIGLSIAKKAVERRGGRIWAESKPGEGTAFFFTLPAAPAPEEAGAFL